MERLREAEERLLRPVEAEAQGSVAVAQGSLKVVHRDDCMFFWQ